MKSILFVFRRNRAKWLMEWKAGKGPCEFLYGMPYMAEKGINVDFIEGDDTSRHWEKILCLPFEKWMSRQTGIGFGLHITWMNWNKIKKADVILSTVDACGLPIAMLKCMGKLPGKLIYISQGLHHNIQRRGKVSRIAQFIMSKYEQFLNAADLIIVLGEGAAEPLINTFKLSRYKVKSVPFGIDEQFWTPSKEKEVGDYILSVGSDQARDYETLLKAVSDIKLKIVTRLPVQHLIKTKTIEVGSEYTQVELRELYRNAKFVIVPLKDVDQPSGQSAALQAMACSKAVILTRTKGLWESAYMLHGENCYLVDPGDTKQLAEAIDYLNSKPEEVERLGNNARQLVEMRYKSKDFAMKMEAHIREIL